MNDVIFQEYIDRAAQKKHLNMMAVINSLIDSTYSTDPSSGEALKKLYTMTGVAHGTD